MSESVPAHIASLIRHFSDLRDGTHGGSASRKDKEAHFEKAVQLLAPVARQVLTEMNTCLLLDTGQFTETGLRRTADGGLIASWVLSWPEQQAAGVEPIALQAYFGGGFHHTHLRGNVQRVGDLKGKRGIVKKKSRHRTATNETAADEAKLPTRDCSTTTIR